MQGSVMKRLLLLLCVCPLVVQAQVCLGTQFKAQAMSINDTQEREAFASKWLKDNIPTCKSEQLRSILSSSPLWLGTALTAKISGLIEAAIEAKSLDDPAALEILLNPPLKKAAANNTTNVLEARAQGGRAGVSSGAPAVASDNPALTQAATIAAAAATAAAIVQQRQNTPPPQPSGK
jgi:hypothetical protein